MPNRQVNNRFGIPFLGFGLGLRAPHFDQILATHPKEVDWFEVITENFLEAPTERTELLQSLRQRYPLCMHGVGLSIGSPDPLDEHYVSLWLRLIAAINPVVVSDHLCWTGVDSYRVHDLLPVVYNAKSLEHTADKIKQVQDRLGRVLALENPSTYVEWQDSSYPEAEFLARLAERADCAILLDVNNVFVSAFNHHWDADEYLQTLPFDRVVQVHLAGHSVGEHHRIDTHDAAILPEVLNLYESVINRLAPVSTMIERDAKIPPLEELLSDLADVRRLATKAWSLSGGMIGPQVVGAATPTGVQVPMDGEHSTSRLTVDDSCKPDGLDPIVPYNWLQATIFHGQRVRDIPHIRVPPTEAAEARVNIYWEAYRFRFKEMLQAECALTEAYLGELNFARACARLLSTDPPRHFNLDHYAIDFLDAQALAFAEDPVGLELLAIDRALMDAWQADKLPVLQATDLVGVNEAGLLRLMIQRASSVQIVITRHLDASWRQTVRRVLTDKSIQGASELTLKSLPSELDNQTVETWPLVINRHGSLSILELSQTELELLQLLDKPMSMERLIAEFPLGTDSWATLWTRWLAKGILAVKSSGVTS